MATDKDFSAQEWKTITTAPVAAGLLVALADPSGPIGVVKEAMAVNDAIEQSATNSGSEVVKSVAKWAKAAGRLEAPRSLPGDKTKLKKILLDSIQQSAAIIRSKAPSEAAQYRQFLLDVAQKAAAASKEGGFLGFGGVQVSGDEKALLAELSAALGTPS
jgi:hypothetical protein